MRFTYIAPTDFRTTHTGRMERPLETKAGNGVSPIKELENVVRVYEATSVALAIVAETKAVLAGRRGGSSRERTGTLHERTDPIRDLPRQQQLETARAAA